MNWLIPRVSGGSINILSDEKLPLGWEMNELKICPIIFLQGYYYKCFIIEEMPFMSILTVGL